MSASDLGGRLGAELDALLAESFAGWLLLVVLVLLAAWAVSRGVAVLVRLAHSLWADANHRIDRVAAVVHLLVMVFSALLIVRPLFLVAPLAIGTAALVSLWIVAQAAPGPIEDLLAGISLLRRRTLREGATVALGPTRGVIVEIGLWWTRLQASDGSAVLIPNRLFNRTEIAIGAAADTARVQLELELPRNLTPAQLDAAQRVLLTSPFRLPSGYVSVSPCGDRRISVELETWARLETDVVRRRVAATMSALVRDAEPRGGDDA